ncbi:MAG TPA: tRNA epoxyqueuosine(34) reductase QueG [Candidatus Limnocylindria bacterium]|nr:tRNA epoxyqueuosine(34) reductase QueG [Candidatus Limnocylindria bacterium]
MKAAVQQRARELGFDACRITSAAAPATAAQFQQAMAEGRHGEMAWLARNAEKRTDPQLVLPGARSVIVLAVSYESDEWRVSNDELGAGAQRAPAETRNSKLVIRNSGRVARYARYADYHDVLAGPLKQLSAFVDGLGGSGTRSLWYVDTGPVLERDLAQRAGLGFVGKHTNLISRSLGNWFFLAEILTTLELEPDAAEHNHCGSCTRCLTACPTNALPAPFTLDARRCISYLTIELKGSIPVGLRPLIGDHIYGCDDCLAACPWNRFAREGRLMKASARADLDQPDLLELLALDAAAFKAKFAGSPVLRTKRRGLLRNVCVALGNVGDASALPALERAAADPEPLIAEHATWALAQIRQRAGSGPPVQE